MFGDIDQGLVATVLKHVAGTLAKIAGAKVGQELFGTTPARSTGAFIASSQQPSQVQQIVNAKGSILDREFTHSTPTGLMAGTVDYRQAGARNVLAQEQVLSRSSMEGILNSMLTAPVISPKVAGDISRSFGSGRSVGSSRRSQRRLAKAFKGIS